MDARNNIATDLFYKIRSRFSGLKLGAETGQITINPSDARFFDFDYMEGETAIGHVSISLAESNSLKVYFSSGITESMDSSQKNKWYGFLKELRQFAKRRLMSFDTRDIAKDMLDKRDFEFLSQNSQIKPSVNTTPPVGESVMSESAMYGSRTMSYQKLMDTRLIIKHSKAVMDDLQPGARTRNISALFVENQDGERFKYPFIHLAGARAMQRHVANTGVPYDDLGKSIVSMSEEIAQLKSFSNYVVRNDLMNSENNSIIERGQARLESLREQIKALSKQSHYENYKEHFQAQEQMEIPESVIEDFTEKFTVKNFREDIKSAFPALYRLMQEENTIGYDDIVAMTQEDITEHQEPAEAYDPFDKFEQWAMNLGEESAISSKDQETQGTAVKELQELIGEKFPAGVDGTNAIESLNGIIEDPQLYKEIKDQAKQDPDVCVRPLVKEWLEQNAPEVVDQLDFGDMVDEPAAAQGGDQTAPEEEPQMAADDPDERNKKDSEDFDPYDVENISDQDPRIMSGASRQGYMRSDKNFLTKVFGPPSPEGYWLLKFTNGVIVMIKPDEGGRRGDEDDYKIFSKDPNAQRYIDAAIDPDEWQGESADERNKDDKDDLPFEPDKKSSFKKPNNPNRTGRDSAKALAQRGMRQAMDIKEVAEFINSFYDRDSGTFPKGPEGVVVMVGKKFGEQAEQVARRFVERMAPHQEQGAEQMQELARIRELAGMPGNDMAGGSKDRDLEEKRYEFQRIKFRGTDHDIGEERYRFAIDDNPMVFNFSSNEDNPDPDSPSFEEILAKVQRDGAVEHFQITPAEQRLMAKKIEAERRKYLDQRRNDGQREEGIEESQDDIYTITNPDLERDAETGREEPDQIEVKVEFSSYDDEFEIDKVFRLDTKEDITDKVVNDRQLYFDLANDVQQREQGRDRDYESIQDDVTPELEDIKRLSGIAQGLGY